MPNHIKTYRPVLNAMDELTRENLPHSGLRLACEEKTGLEIYYTTHCEWINPNAQVLFVGICPGFEQMQLSFDILKAHPELTDTEVQRLSKTHARFGRSMRKNLITMLDRIGLPQALGASDAAALFAADCELIDNTCLIPYPVFRDGKNYNGHTPKISASLLLTNIMTAHLTQVLPVFKDALIIPLGKCVGEVLKRCTQNDVLKTDQILWHFPHPSGANGHRHRIFKDHLAAYRRAVRAHFAAQAENTNTQKP